MIKVAEEPVGVALFCRLEITREREVGKSGEKVRREADEK